MDKVMELYEDTATWNPFCGCAYNCVYCVPTYQDKLKREGEKIGCIDCYNYRPHLHHERLKEIPNAKIVFVAGDGDISFCSPSFTELIIENIKEHNKSYPHINYFFHSKCPEYFGRFLTQLPQNVVLETTLETNIDEGYERISKAPKPTQRYLQFCNLSYPRKVVTVAPIMDFDSEAFVRWIENIKPEYVWVEFNGRPNDVSLPEPSLEKTKNFIEILKRKGIEVKGKELRGLEI